MEDGQYYIILLLESCALLKGFAVLKLAGAVPEQDHYNMRAEDQRHMFVPEEMLFIEIAK